MIRHIFNTAASRVFNTLLGLLLLVVNTKVLGAALLGELVIQLFTINLIVICSEVIGGPSLVYFQSRKSESELLGFSYLWAILVSLVGVGIESQLSIMKLESWGLILGICTIQSINHTHLHLLVGRREYQSYNWTTILQNVVLLVAVLLGYFVWEAPSITTFFYAYFIAQGTVFLYTIGVYRKSIAAMRWSALQSGLLKEMFTYGLSGQLANVFQFGVYRLNYLILELFTGAHAVGVYSLGNQLVEKALIPARAVNMVQYSEIANLAEKQRAVQMTVKVFFLSVGLSAVALGVLALVPDEVYRLVFDEDFVSSRGVILLLAPGILMLSVSGVYSHFFSGLGKYYYNTLTSFLGVVTIVGFSYAWIPEYGMEGAAVSATLVYLLQVFVQILIFKKESEMTWKALLLVHVDVLRTLDWRALRAQLLNKN